MKRWKWIALAVAAVLVLIVFPWLMAGVYAGSRTEPLTWVEPGGKEVRGNVLVCRYYKLGQSLYLSLYKGLNEHEVIYFPGPRRDLLLPDGHGTFLQVVPEVVGVTRCPIYGFWTAWANLYRDRPN